MGLRRGLGRWEVRGCCDSLLWGEPGEEILGRCDVSGVYLKLFAPFRGEWSSISILKGHLEQRLKEAEPVGARFAPQDAEGWLRRTENVLEGPGAQHQRMIMAPKRCFWSLLGRVTKSGVYRGQVDS